MRRKFRRTKMEKLVTVMIAGIILVGVGSVVIGGYLGFSGASREEATKHAEEFAKRIGPYLEVSCVDLDTDGDGYVSCTIFREDKDPIFVECTGLLSLNDGCRAPKPQLRY